MSAQPKPLLSPEQYLQLERQSDVRHEFHGGELFAMSGGTLNHSAIALNLGAELRLKLRDLPCRVFSSDLRIKIEATGLYTYPDLSVVCGVPLLEGDRKDTLLNPRVIVEVLSPSTEAYDRGKKFENYRTIPSLQEYLLVATDAPAIERFTRQSDGSWNLTVAKGPLARMPVASLQCELELAEVYAKVGLEAGG